MNPLSFVNDFTLINIIGLIIIVGVFAFLLWRSTKQKFRQEMVFEKGDRL